MKEIRDSPPTFTTETARAHGVHPRDLYAWRDVAFRSQRAIVCCLSAAAVHELTDELPRVWASD